MNKKKVAALLAALLVTLGALSACSTQTNTSTKGSNGLVSTAQADQNDYVPKTKRFEPGTHCYACYYRFVGNEGYNYFKAQVNIPEGYEIKDIEITTNAYSSAEGIIYWFINTKTVEATEAKNTNDSWAYCVPGKVVEEDMELALGN